MTPNMLRQPLLKIRLISLAFIIPQGVEIKSEYVPLCDFFVCVFFGQLELISHSDALDEFVPVCLR